MLMERLMHWLPWRRGDWEECARVAKFLHYYLDGELDDRTTSLVARHLEDCRRCGLDAETYLEIRRALQHDLRPPEDVVGRLREFSESLVSEERES